jgi:transposase
LAAAGTHVISTDEKTGMQALERLHATKPVRPGLLERVEFDVSATLVELIARRCGIEEDLGMKGKTGILKSKKTRRRFLQDTLHRIRFVYTPRHCSWLNQVEIWFSILARRLLKRSSFTSLEDLHRRTLAFIEYFNAVLGKPFRWTYTGRPLQA